MFSIRAMTGQDRDAVMSMVLEFYHSPAVEHEVDAATLEKTFWDAVDPAEGLLRGLLLEEDGEAVGYAYVTFCYSGEMGGRVVFFDELYFRPQCRGKGYGTQVFRWLKREYPDYPRFRLEVTEANEKAARLYARLGFRTLEYRQMVLDGDLAQGERKENLE
ncbi:GNAT family N-acetyltransferase [Pseudoflavonifractor phocaeensis]|uniref:GNAT family N-acetyltransferase n=1 Tax=Pseudoflavonifractor phocaeensis TaxID=1870988 RepID=UPI00195A5382|nr:GNAT family N-acetyltransferase [Pseudoflavonifractor phocaeensis]MBM6870218.1 GNAT family N-acetyltransferase [Pseudoflavonifractor phocaeensis]